MNKTVVVNLKAIKDCMMAIPGGGSFKYNLSGVYIEDSDGYRHYVGMNGYILVHAYETVEKGDALKKPICIVPRGKFICLSKNKYANLSVVDENTALINNSINKIVCDVVFDEYPDYKNLIPTEAPKINHYTCFDDKYLRILHVILKHHYPLRPFQKDAFSPAMWYDEMDGIRYEIVIMPMRTFD